MSKDLSNYRKSYLLGELIESALPEDPLELFSDWFSNVEKIGKEIEPNAMSLAAINSENLPISRIVLLKKFDVEGFVFYTNYNSRKGKSISVNPAVCLSFFWSSVEQQVIINGVASKISGKESDIYFNSSFDKINLSGSYALGGNAVYQDSKIRITNFFSKIGENYNPEVGFLRRKNVLFYSPSFRYLFYPKSGKINSHGPEIDYEFYNHPEYGDTDRQFELDYTLNFINNSRFNLRYQKEYTYLLYDFFSSVN